MNIKYTNVGGVPLAMLPWLVHDTYDHSDNPNQISATSLLKPLKQVVLTSKITDAAVEVSTLTASRIGTAIHDAIERSWMTPESVQKAFKLAGYPTKIANSVVVNPSADMDLSDKIPVYIEQRVDREFLGYTLSGKFDIVIDGTLGDFKNTSVFTYMNQTNAEKYIQQGSIYRWLNPSIITQDYMEIYHQFTDWSALNAQTQRDKGYPQSKLMTVKYELMSLRDTERFIKDRLSNLTQAKSMTQEELPDCTDDELWRSESVYKYYADPNKLGRSTKNFDDYLSAHTHLANMGKGIVLEVKGKAKACNYCSANPICLQAESLRQQGLL
jgi:hypothetical protein